MYSQKHVLWHCKYLWNYNTDRQAISGPYLDNENVSGNAVLWRHNKSKMVHSHHLEDRSVKNHPILIKFGTLKQILNLMSVMRPKLKFFKFKTAAAAILKIAFLVITSNDCQISAKFCMRKQNDVSTRATWQKLQIFKIQDGGRPPFWKL